MIKFYVALIAIFPLLGISTNVNIRAYKHYEIVEWGEIDQNINLKEDSISIVLDVVGNNSKYYNAYWTLESKSGIKAKMRIHNQDFESSFILSCFHAYKEGRIVSFYFKDTKAEEFIYSVLGRSISKEKVSGETYKCEYSYYNKDSTLIRSYFKMIKK